MKTESKMATTTILVNETVIQDLRAIAETEQRSVGFLIRAAVDAWLAGRREQAGVRTGTNGK